MSRRASQIIALLDLPVVITSNGNSGCECGIVVSHLGKHIQYEVMVECTLWRVSGVKQDVLASWRRGAGSGWAGVRDFGSKVTT